MELIDKAALVAEINRVLNSYDPNEITSGRYALVSLRNFIDTLEVKKVDLEREYNNFIKSDNGRSMFETAKHFFELGIKAQKMQDEIKIGETEIYLEDDGGEPPYDGTQWLDLSCMEYEIPKDKFKDGDNVEIIIRKTQKGE